MDTIIIIACISHCQLLMAGSLENQAFAPSIVFNLSLPKKKDHIYPSTLLLLLLLPFDRLFISSLLLKEERLIINSDYDVWMKTAFNLV